LTNPFDSWLRIVRIGRVFSVDAMMDERPANRRYYIWTIGCQMNKAESERFAAYLDSSGLQSATSPFEADIILLNSCVVRQSAENRAINKLHSLKALKKARPEVIIAVTGCLVEDGADDLKKRFPFVDHFFPAGQFPPWLGEYDVRKLLPRTPGVAAFVPIMQGCNNFCTYCIVPYRRGREKSRLPEEIESEVRDLVGRGVKEVTLLGQNVDSYGHDLPQEAGLADLLGRLNAIAELRRIRFLTNHPKDMQPDLIRAVAGLDKVCEQINLPLQAGDDTILRAMRRGYAAEHYRRLIVSIRAAVPEIALSTDVIVGFPGESDLQFQHTYELLSEIRFDLVHVAAYSPRPGTVAAREMADDVPQAEKKRRLESIEQLQTKIAGEINAHLQGSVVEVLVEGQEKEKWFGRTRGDKLVFFRSEADCRAKLVAVTITHTSPWSLSGRPAQDAGLKSLA
jgi:tRNA-2-methylthio-N6-dimethylallyladenosine synthase